MAGENTFSTLQGWFKELYASSESRPLPKAAYLLKNVDFSKAERGVGNKYHMPVVLTHEHGVTVAGPSAGAFTLNAAVASVLKDATIEGTQILLRARMDYESAARAANTKASFGQATELLVKNMLESISKRLEIMMLYGRTGIGAVNANTVSSTSFVISAASWANAIWAGMEGARIDVLLADLSAYDAGGTANGLTIATIAFGTRTVTLTTPVSLTSTALVFFYGAVIPGVTPTHNEFQGLDSIITNITTLYGIANSQYNMFQGNTQSLSSASMTVTNILNALLPSIGKGLMQDVALICSPKAFQGLVNPVVDPKASTGSANSQVGGTRIDRKGGSTLELGSSSAKIMGNQGMIEIVPHLFCKDGEAFVVPLEHLKRVGATDVTFNTPGRGDEFFLQLPDNAGFELRVYANQALFVETPGWCTKLTNIT